MALEAFLFPLLNEEKKYSGKHGWDLFFYFNPPNNIIMYKQFFAISSESTLWKIDMHYQLVSSRSKKDRLKIKSHLSKFITLNYCDAAF